MKFLITSDWQAAPSNIDKCRRVLSQICDLVEEHDIDTVFHLGDVKEAFNPVDQRVTNFLVEFATAISRKCHLVVLRGNHDRIAMHDSSADCFPILEAAGAFVFSEPGKLVRGKTEFYLVPFFRDPIRFQQVVRQFAREASVSTAKQKYLLFHQEIYGARLNSHGGVSTDGVKHRRVRNTHFTHMIGGHLHLPHTVFQNVHYVGSAFSCDWSEVNQTKRYIIIDTDTPDDLISIPTRMPGHYDKSMKSWKPSFKPADGSVFRARVELQAGQTEPDARGAAETLFAAAHPFCRLQVEFVFPDEDLKEDVSTRFGDEEAIREYTRITGMSPAAVPYLLYQLQRQSAIVVADSGIELLEGKGRNFLCFREVHINYQDQGIVLVTGVNRDWGEDGSVSIGSGKTSLLQLPLVALFGRTLKGQSGDAWRSRFCNDTAVASLKFKLADGRVCLVTRQRSPAKLTLEINGVLYPLPPGNAAQTELQRIIGMTWDTMVNGLYVDQTRVSRILVGTDKERKEVLSQFLQLHRFKLAQEFIAADRVMRNTERAALEAEIAQLRTRVQDHKHVLKYFAPTDDLKKMEGSLAAVEWKLRGERVELKKAEEAKQVARSKLVDTELELGLERARKAQAETAIDRAEKSKGKTCPQCGQRILRRSVESTLVPLRRQYDIHKERVEALEQDLANEEETAARLETAYKNAADAVQSLLLRQRDLDERIARSRERAAQYAEAHGRLQEVRRLLSLSKRALRDCLLDLALLDSCHRAFGRNGIPALLITQLLPRLNRAARRFSQMFSSSRIRVVFKRPEAAPTAEPDIYIDVSNAKGGAGISDQSQGETRIASLIASFAIREVLLACNVLILDEPGEGLDAHNAREFAARLLETRSQFSTILVTTHNPNISAVLAGCKNLEVVKQGGVAKLVSL